MAASSADLNIVLFGKTGAGKSASGNTILGRQAFESRKSAMSLTRYVKMESGSVVGFPVDVYDTPGLQHTDMSEEELKRKYEDLLRECESGPCVFLIVIKADRFTPEERETVEKIEKILGPKHLQKTWILFTRGDDLEEENITIQKFIEDNKQLKTLVQKYDQRYHLFNNRTRGDPEQVKKLVTKLKTSFMKGSRELRIVLLGDNGVGKSASGNTIMGREVFKSVTKTNSVTPSKSQATVSGRSVTVVDTSGFFDTQREPDDVMKERKEIMYLCVPGPHAFLIVFPVNKRFTEKEQEILKTIDMVFGEEALKCSIILFTHGDHFNKESVEELIKRDSVLRDVVDQCGGRYHVFNNRDEKNREQVDDLLLKIELVILQNEEKHYIDMHDHRHYRYLQIKYIEICNKTLAYQNFHLEELKRIEEGYRRLNQELERESSCVCS